MFRLDFDGVIGLIFVVVVFFVTIGSTFGIMPNYSDGEKSGYLTSLSHKGLIVKTWEGVMNMGGMRKEEDAEGRVHLVPNTFSFTVLDTKLVPELEKKLQDGGFVTLKYDQWYMKPWNVGSSYIIKEIK